MMIGGIVKIYIYPRYFPIKYEFNKVIQIRCKTCNTPKVRFKVLPK